MKDPPPGLISWLRRRPLPWAARAFALAGLAGVAAWCVGRIVGDRTMAGQYLVWLPTLWAVGFGWVMLAASAALGHVSLRMGGDRLRPLLVLACIGLSVWMLIGEWRVHRVVRVKPAQPTLRVAAWNMAVKSKLESPAETVLALGPDIALVANPPYALDRTGIARTLGSLGKRSRGSRSNGAFTS